MNESIIMWYPLIIIILAPLHIMSLFSGSAALGVNYGKLANDLPPPADVVTLIQSISLTKSKLYDADPKVLRAFGNTGISFVVGIANEELESLMNPALAMAWVQDNVVTYLPATRISGIVVGNEIFMGTDVSLMAQLLPAMRNVYTALRMFDLHRHISVSTNDRHVIPTVGGGIRPRHRQPLHEASA